MARRTKEQLAEVKATARHYLALTNNDAQKAWNEYIKYHLLNNMSFSKTGITLKDFVAMQEQNSIEQQERDAFFLQCDKERELAKGAAAKETEEQYINRLLAMPKDAMQAIYAQFKTTIYKDVVVELYIAHAQQCNQIGRNTLGRLKEIIN